MKFKQILFFSLNIILLSSFTSCDNQNSKIIDLLSYQDMKPPQFISIKSESKHAFILTFDEKIQDRFHTKVFLDNRETSNFIINKSFLTIFSSKAFIPGQKYNIEVQVEDFHGNTTTVEASPYAKNSNPAQLLISEISTKGTSKYGDRVEFVVIKKGNLAGITISDGFFDNYNDCCTLPNFEVMEGEIFVVSFQKNTQGDFYSEKQEGLSSYNGCILISSSQEKRAQIQDCIIYSSKTSKTYEGFGNKNILNTAKILSYQGHWQESSPQSLVAVDSKYETSTRTINRKVDSYNNLLDTNTSSDFYITIQGGQSFGLPNNKEAYQIE